MTLTRPKLMSKSAFENDGATAINLYAVAQRVAGRLSSFADQGVRVRVEGASACIAGSETLAEEMLYNLIENGIRYNHEGGLVTMKVGSECMEGGLANAAYQTVVRVSDTGPGIPAELHDKVFERFFRVDKPLEGNRRNGTGLAIVKHAVMYHGGVIEVGERRRAGHHVRAALSPALDLSSSIEHARLLRPLRRALPFFWSLRSGAHVTENIAILGRKIPVTAKRKRRHVRYRERRLSMAEYNDDLNYPDPFYISDIETYELLHVNEAGRRLFKVPLDADLEGVKCYEFLQGRDEPCPFCTNHLFSVEKSYVWEFTNPLTNHRHLLNDRLINWGGKLVRLEVGFDLTDQKEEGMRWNLHRNEEVILEIANDLYRETDPERASVRMLERLGEELGAERSYLFSARGEGFSNTHEWWLTAILPDRKPSGYGLPFVRAVARPARSGGM